MTILRCVIVCVAALAAPRHAVADDDVAGAAKAFSQAQEVMLTGDVARAADLFELADELSPSAPALRNATRARFHVNHHAMAASHAAELLRRYPSDKESRTVAEAILSKLAPELAQLEVTCSSSCTLQVDGKALTSRPREQFFFFTQPGVRALSATFEDGRKTTDSITALVNHTTSVRLEAPPKAIEPKPVVVEAPSPVEPAKPPAPRGGISRLWFVAGAVVTLGVGTMATLSGMQTLATRDDIRDSVGSGAQSGAVDLYNKGRDQQLRTNILLGATGAAAVGTIVLAIFTNWSGASSAEVALVPSSGGLGVAYGSRF